VNIIAILVASLASFWVQDPATEDTRLVTRVLALEPSPLPVLESPLHWTASLTGDPDLLFASPWNAAPIADEKDSSFSLGPVAGLIFAKDADRGTWFGGVQARLHFAKFFAVEAAITFHQNHYENGDVVVTQYPLQLTAFLYIIPEGPIRPYILGGVGWYYTRIDYKDSFAVVNNDQTESQFGEHFGAGVEIMLGAHSSLNADVRYIFINATNDNVFNGDFNYWQLTLGVNFYF
jgi:outer membrane protein W